LLQGKKKGAAIFGLAEGFRSRGEETGALAGRRFEGSVRENLMKESAHPVYMKGKPQQGEEVASLWRGEAKKHLRGEKEELNTSKENRRESAVRKREKG